MAEDSRRSVKRARYVIKDGNAAGPARDGAVVNRSSATGRYVSRPEQVAAARARVTADKKRGAITAPWIVELAKRAG